MDEDGLPIVGAGVDYSKVDPIHQKRTLTFLNHFLVHTTSFLNHFATVCDEKLENLLIRIQRLEASMSILEAKLSSIPGLDDITLTSQASDNVNEAPPPAQTPNTDTPPAQPQTDVPSSEPAPAASAQSEPEKSVLKVSQDPRFAKYFKMVNLGVPVPAVKLKMSAEGVNADLLDDPDVPAPPGAPSASSQEDDADSDSSDEYSD